MHFFTKDPLPCLNLSLSSGGVLFTYYDALNNRYEILNDFSAYMYIYVRVRVRVGTLCGEKYM